MIFDLQKGILPEPNPEDNDFTPMQMTKIALGFLFGFVICFLLWKIDKNQVTQIIQNGKIIEKLDYVHLQK